MKSTIHFLIKLVFTLIMIFIIPEIYADPPDPGGGPGGGPMGGGAPVGDGIVVFIIASIGYILYYVRKWLHQNIEIGILRNES